MKLCSHSLCILGVVLTSGLLAGDVAAEIPPVSSEAAGGICDTECDWCHCGTSNEGDCPDDWYYDLECDCGCQWSDPICSGYVDQECQTGGAEGACCDPYQVAPACYDASTLQACYEYGGAYMGNSVNCAAVACGSRCDAQCAYCWSDTYFQNNCDPTWEGDGWCDCGCDFDDPDCAASQTGACCNTSQLIPECYEETVGQACYNNGAAYMGDGVGCAAVDCGNRCAAECQWCFTGTIAENNCDPNWAADGECDCGCQFCDPDCPSCQTGVCNKLGDLTGNGVVDLLDCRTLPGCLLGPGGGVSAFCVCVDFDVDGDTDLQDIAALQLVFGG